MKQLSMKEKLEIVNSGGSFEETGSNSWKDCIIKKGDRLGKVVGDWNGACRTLIVLFNDGVKETISLNNIGGNPEEVHQYEWLSRPENIWYRF